MQHELKKCVHVTHRVDNPHQLNRIDGHTVKKQIASRRQAANVATEISSPLFDFRGCPKTWRSPWRRIVGRLAEPSFASRRASGPPHGELAQALYVGLLFVVVQTLEGYVITPMVQQRMVHLPPAAGLSLQIVFGALWGFAGLALATPFAAVAMVLIQKLYVEDALGDHAHGEAG